MFRLCTWIWTFTVIVHSLGVVFTLVLLNKQQGTTCMLPKVLRLEKRCSAHSSLAIFFYLYFLNLTASLHLWPYGGMGPGWWWWWVEGISNLNICKQFWVFSLFILCLWFQSMTMFIIQKIINHWERTIIHYHNEVIMQIHCQCTAIFENELSVDKTPIWSLFLPKTAHFDRERIYVSLLSSKNSKNKVLCI